MVLAINYELVSDATRAIDALRRVEELTPDDTLDAAQRSEFAALRARLASFVDLPALPEWRIVARSGDRGYVPPVEVDALWERFLSMGADDQ